MDVTLLIDAIVRQTMVLVAQLATAGGARAPLARIANLVFVDLVRELKERGLANKVIADMFGLALRTYHERVQRLAESASSQGRSLWEAVLDFVQERRVVGRADVLLRFAADDERTVRAVLSDLVDSGLVFRTGKGDAVSYRASDPSEVPPDGDETRKEGLAHWVHVAIARSSPIDRAGLEQRLGWGGPALDEALQRLLRSDRITTSGPNGDRYAATDCVIPFGTPAGWEAAVFDHFQAMVTAISTKVRMGQRHAELRDAIGGSTYHFDLWRGHPMEREVLGLLGSIREQASALRTRLVEYNRAHAADTTARGDEVNVVMYVGQTVLGLESNGEGPWEEDD
jgi:hypothetical protein